MNECFFCFCRCYCHKRGKKRKVRVIIHYTLDYVRQSTMNNYLYIVDSENGFFLSFSFYFFHDFFYSQFYPFSYRFSFCSVCFIRFFFSLTPYQRFHFQYTFGKDRHSTHLNAHIYGDKITFYDILKRRTICWKLNFLVSKSQT